MTSRSVDSRCKGSDRLRGSRRVSVRITQQWVRPSMGGSKQPDVGLRDLAGAVVRIADALDRGVFVLEELAVRMDVVHPDDIGPSPTAQKIADS